MAVQPNQRGNGIGNKMMQFALRFAEQHHWKKVLLYSNTIFGKLHSPLPQVWLYRSAFRAKRTLFAREYKNGNRTLVVQKFQGNRQTFQLVVLPWERVRF